MGVLPWVDLPDLLGICSVTWLGKLPGCRSPASQDVPMPTQQMCLYVIA